MSAIPAKADVAGHAGMSALCQKRTSEREAMKRICSGLAVLIDPDDAYDRWSMYRVSIIPPNKTTNTTTSA